MLPAPFLSVPYPVNFNMSKNLSSRLPAIGIILQSQTYRSDSNLSPRSLLF